MNRRDLLGALMLAGTTPGFVSSALGASLASGRALGRRSPESQGIASGAIEAFLDAIDAGKVELHSLMILRHGAVVAEGWWAPYRPAAPHDLYSVSKTFTSTAIGLAVADGRLATSTKVVDLFPDKLPRVVDDRLARLRVSHLLTMTTGHALDMSGRVTSGDDWVRAFLAEPMVEEPGARFVYDNAASYMLSAIVQKLYGKRLVEVLDERLFAPLGIAAPRWDTCPRGINTGGWGLSLPSEALARFGQLYLDQGRFNGRQLVPAAWIAEASAPHIQQLPDVPVTIDGAQFSDPDAALVALKKSSDSYQGYGYQMWRGRHDAYRADGAFGQFVVVMPEQQAVIIVTAGTIEPARILNLVWDHLLPAMKDAPLAPSKATSERLSHRLAGLTLAWPEGRATSSTITQLANRRFTLTENPLGTRALTFTWRHNHCELSLERADGPISIPLGFGRWISSRVNAPGLVPWFAMFKRTVRPPEIAVAGAFACRDDQTLILRLQYRETPHHHCVTVRISDGGLVLEASDGYGPTSRFCGRADEISS